MIGEILSLETSEKLAKLEKIKKYLEENDYEYVYLDCKFCETQQYKEIKKIIEG